MAKHIIQCSEPWFTYIKKGIKSVEGRKGTPKWSIIKVGDLLTFKDGKDNQFETIVTGINKYTGAHALKDYLETETLARALPDPKVKNIEDGMKIYHQWSTPAEIIEYGFLGIQIKVI